MIKESIVIALLGWVGYDRRKQDSGPEFPERRGNDRLTVKKSAKILDRAIERLSIACHRESTDEKC